MLSAAVKHAADALRRDIEKACIKTDKKGIDIYLKSDGSISEECFKVVKTGGLAAPEDPEKTSRKTVVVYASGDLGFIYGIYYISRTFLGIQDLWFWKGQRISKAESYEIPDNFIYGSKPFRIRFRGWFINDEVLFDGWRDQCGENFPWEMAFEALLRCGGNMTIPGTDMNAHRYRKLASEYGLWITHHHAEPLGAEMFARVYPELEASYKSHPDLFRDLWRKAISGQKDMKVIWNIGFRGQGDRPFWADDPSYDTPAARGKLVSDLMAEQINMIKEQDENCICCMNLYGEIMELYRGGFLDIPANVIKIRADNGYGKMVTRRQNNHNPRVPSLPAKKDDSANGIYYHASFYDLQAAAMMTMLPNSAEFVINELNEAVDRGADDFWVINCSHIKPHTYYLDLIAGMWRGESCLSGDPAAAADNFTSGHCKRYYGTGITPNRKGSSIQKAVSYAGTLINEETAVEEIADLYRHWPEYAVKYGPNEDDHAGEQFPNHVSRILACAFIRNFCMKDPEKAEKCNELNWLTGDGSLKDQNSFCLERFERGSDNYKEYFDKCRGLRKSIEKSDIPGGMELAEQFGNDLVCQVEYLYYSYLGAVHICRALRCCLGEDGTRAAGVVAEKVAEQTAGSGIAGKKEGLRDRDWTEAFYEAGLARKAFAEGYSVMRSHEEGIWQGFYKNDCEADIRQSAFVAGSLMSYLRILGDGPHFYKWQRRFQNDAGGDKVHLLLRLKEHLSDEELWEIMDSER